MKSSRLGMLGVALLVLAGAGGSKGWAEDRVASGDPIVVVALAKVKAGSEEIFKAAVTKILAPTRAEAGNMSYVYHQGTESLSEFAFVEQWRGDDEIAFHMSSPHMQAFFKAVGNLFEPGYPIIKKYRRVQGQ